MARCIDCAWFPWKPGADLSGLPAMRCHPALPLRRWGDAKVETTCERFQTAECATAPSQPERESRPKPPAATPSKSKPKTKRKG